MSDKPLGQKAYGHIAHLPGSRMGPGDHSCHPGQARIATERTRDRHDQVWVQEKLDGSCVSVARIEGLSDVMLNVDGHLVPLREEGSTGLTRELGEALGWPTVPDTARQILLTLFARANSPELHVTSVAVRYQEWLEDADQVVVEAVLGE